MSFGERSKILYISVLASDRGHLCGSLQLGQTPDLPWPGLRSHATTWSFGPTQECLGLASCAAPGGSGTSARRVDGWHMGQVRAREQALLNHQNESIYDYNNLFNVIIIIILNDL